MRHAFAQLFILILSILATAPAVLAEPPAGGTEAATEADEAPAPSAVRRRNKPSRYTNDESERAADKRRLLLTTGEDRTVDLDFAPYNGANDIMVGNPGIVVATLAKIGEQRQIVFKPLKAGETTVTVRGLDGNIGIIFTVVVTGNNLLRRASELRDLLRDIEGIDIRVVGQKIVVDGEVLVPNDYARVTQVVNSMDKGLVLNLTILSPIAVRVLADRIKVDIAVFAPKVDVRVVNGMIFLEGTVPSKDMADRAVQLALLYLPEAKPANPLVAADPNASTVTRRMVHNFIMVDAPPPRKQEKLVRVTIHYVELAKNYNRYFGFKWAPGFTTADANNPNGGEPTVRFGDTGSQSNVGPGFTAIISKLLPKLQSGQDAGFARVLKSSTIIVRSGQPASIKETTEFPFTRQAGNGQIVGDSKAVGLNMAVTPRILGQSEDIEMDLDLSQSVVVGAGVNGGAPVSADHAVKTKIYVKSNESAAVAGVNSSDVKTGFNQDDPDAGKFNGNTTELFNLKHTKNYNKRKGQFVIFVTPQIIENASEGTEDLKRNFRVKVK